MSLPAGTYIAVEGVIGAGKTSLARILAEKLDAELVLEQPADNPFLVDFYLDRETWAFQTQLSFLLTRHRQQAALKQRDLFKPTLVSDYIFEKDRLFARLNLNDREFELYRHIADSLQADVLTPDLIVWIKSPPERLMKHIRIRDRECEQPIEQSYLEELCEAYSRFFASWDKSALLIVDGTWMDFVNNDKHREQLVSKILENPRGTQYVEIK